jgi:hypothetical protein
MAAAPLQMHAKAQEGYAHGGGRSLLDTASNNHVTPCVIDGGNHRGSAAKPWRALRKKNKRIGKTIKRLYF